MGLDVHLIHRVDNGGSGLPRQPQSDEIIDSGAHENVTPPFLSGEPPNLEALEVDAAEPTTPLQFVDELTRQAQLATPHRRIKFAKDLTGWALRGSELR